MPTVVVPSGYSYAQQITVTGGGAAVTGSTTTPKPTGSADYVVQLHLTGSVASTIYSQLQHAPGSTVDSTATADIAVFWWNGSAWVQIAADFDQVTNGLWSTANITLRFGLQASLAASPAIDDNYMLVWGSTTAQGQNWANLYAFNDDFLGSTLSGSWSTLGTTSVSLSGSVVTLSSTASGDNGIETGALWGTGLVAEMYGALYDTNSASQSGISLLLSTAGGSYIQTAFDAGISTAHWYVDSGGTTATISGTANASNHLFTLARDAAGNATGSAAGNKATVGGAYTDTANLTLYLYDPDSTAVHHADWVKVRPWISSEPTPALTGSVVSGGSSLGLTATDAASSSDATALLLVQGVSDTHTLGDAPSFLLLYGAIDRAASADAATGALALSCAERASPAETLAASARSLLVDALSAGDVAAFLAGASATLGVQDALLLLETGVWGATTTAGEGLQAAEQSGLALAFTPREALTPAESCISALIATLADQRYVSDAVGHALVATLSDALTAGDLIAFVASATLTLQLVDSLIVGEASAYSGLATLQEIADLYEAPDFAQALSAADTASLVEATSSLIAQSLDDMAALSERLQAAGAFAHDDAASLLEAAATSLFGTILATDTLAASDAVAMLSLLAASEALQLGDEAQEAAVYAALTTIARLLARVAGIQVRADAAGVQPVARPIGPQVVALTLAEVASMIVKVGDVPPPWTLTLVDQANGNGPINLSSMTVQAMLYGPTGQTVWAQPRPLSVLSPATSGQATLTWQAGDFATAGACSLDVQIVAAQTSVTTIVPTLIEVRPLP